MEILYFYAIILGLVAGSFINAWVYRLNSGESMLFERSHCVNCHKIIRWHDLIPVFSFINLRGKCRDCQKPISIEYPLVELITAILFFLIVCLNRFLVNDFLGWAAVIYQMLLLVFLETIFIFDLKHFLIPNDAIFGALILGVVFKISEFITINRQLANANTLSLLTPMLLSIILGIFVSGGFLWFLAFISKEKWMGWGDVQLGLLMGLVLGYPCVLIALFIAFTVGAIIGVVLVVMNKKKLKGMLPFAPFLIIGTFIAFYWGNDINLWYQSAIGL